jgi:TPR repeat protein
LVELGEFYENGKFSADKSGNYTTAIDLKRSIEYYLKARNMHLPRASNNLGVLYINNKNLIQSVENSSFSDHNNENSNIEIGVRYLEEAKLLGFPQSFYNLGHVYENGLLGNRNLG